MYSEEIMNAIRQGFFELDEGDTSRDDDIAKMDRDIVLSAFLCWNGIIGYTGTILDAIEEIYDCDLEYREFH